jgi:hypothetical protein
VSSLSATCSSCSENNLLASNQCVTSAHRKPHDDPSKARTEGLGQLGRRNVSRAARQPGFTTSARASKRSLQA